MKLTVQRGATHEYEDEDGIKLFSVSQVRRIAYDPYAGIPGQVLEAARYRGMLLHKRFWRVLAAQAGLMEAPPPIPQFAGYCKGMDFWVKEFDVKPVKLESASRSRKYGYAGTPDALVRLGKKRRLTLVDLKTGEPNPTDSMQLVAYQKMEGYEETVDLLDLYVREEGIFGKELGAGAKATEWVWFMSALGVLQSRVNHGLK